MSGLQIAIDRGGTFTDFIARIPGQPDYVFKLLSVDPKNYPDAPTEGIRVILEKLHNKSIPRSQKLNLHSIESIRMGTTVATNALLERKGANVCLVTTKGFKDVLTIGNQTRPNIFDLSAKKLGHLQKMVIEVDERVTIAGFSEGGGDHLKLDDSDPMVVEGATGDKIKILKKPDYLKIEHDLKELYDEGDCKTIALCLVNSYAYPEHEAKIAQICKKIGFQVSVSHELQPMIGIVNRASSTVADAYLSPVIKDYLEGFANGFEGGLEAFGNKLLFMQSNGGLCPWYKFTGLKAILSGPAGGMVGFGETCYDHDTKRATIGFDAGGTSTDVARYSGSLEHIYETVVSEISLQTPQLDISTVAAGGGSMLFWNNGIFVVGPESAGSDPGPACYRKGGPLTVTDANLFLGRLIPEFFPHIFGPNQNEPLDYEITTKKFKELTDEINASGDVQKAFTPEEVALGFLNVAVESMARPIRTITESKGYGTAEHNLACFGGSGGQFAVSLAKNLGISDVAIHKYSSILSAYGIFLADIVIEKQSPISVAYNKDHFEFIDKKVKGLVNAAQKDYEDQGLTAFDTRVEILLNMRFVGSDTHLLISKEEAYDADKRFVARHQKEFGFILDRKVLVDDIQVLFVVESKDKKVHNPYEEFRKLTTIEVEQSSLTNPVYFEENGWNETQIIQLKSLKIGSKVRGPAVILDETQTLLIDPQSTAYVLSSHVLITVEHNNKPQISSTLIDPIQLSVFGHRFMSIAEQMGRTLQQTSISTNIKERLDFSCAVFDKDANLVANAPHVPIHLGSMSFAVKYQLNLYKKSVDGKEVFDLKPGDVLVTNHPIAGGSHLPDVTVITPVLDENNFPMFWVASRGHHADIGSISAGSMPSDSKTIYEEGAAIVSHKLCTEGKFDEAGVKRLFYDEPAKFPGGSGSRALSDNISDLKAQISANYKGITLLQNLVNEFTRPVIELYMGGIQSTADTAVRNLLKLAHKKFQGNSMKAIDYMDDGTLIALTIQIDPETGSAVFDFTESGDEMYGNMNAPKAIVYSAILYVLRSLISSDIPLNNGCLIPITLKTRKGSVVDPSYDAAVVGGNVETTQRIIDVVLKAFEAAAASQGTCNNFTFGINDQENNIKFGYYETICGGAGAIAVTDPKAERKHGQSGVQVHTTNTRITDTEVFERRYPIIVHEFSIRAGSGGDGYHRGGDGVIRDIEFTYPNLQVTCLMNRRALAPFGLKGGQDGLRGQNTWLKKTDEGYKSVSLAGRCSVTIGKGDRVVIMTPGGGGFGSLDFVADDVNYPIKPEKSIYTGSVAMRAMTQETS
ncbi:5-oxoprolinase [Yamadazyma tenuis]|uniref:5-oxoprolinase n=1 Tax=Candida tenuis (strain ATCC 10573 / BCRC 21748 / CBS 615 / JCM 9827 / NBRC 10315 / NRRL Y-1498 / VKM Y-70) TaxID=590646 RepID=G3AXH5_CANTC|nr:uncharacterized protein CANTEDRAFT_100908 [Yamadazyma tenuis ATCC 10573]EGV66381.1 hypothetical protein CANTEDRAFT_100908 [Yamadazyma tenuis ATCC 10573]WEJ95500.1 5-oxoprolinase [Yamadazyma tenuis]